MIAVPQNATIELIERFTLTPNDLVIEVSSGDGLFLRSLRVLGPRVLGVETERRRVVEAFCNGIDTIWGELTPTVAANIRQRYGLARLVIVPAHPSSELLAAAYSCLGLGGTVLLGTGQDRNLEPQRAA